MRKQDAREGLARLHGEPVKTDNNEEKVKIEGQAASKPAQRTVLDSLVNVSQANRNCSLLIIHSKHSVRLAGSSRGRIKTTIVNLSACSTLPLVREHHVGCSSGWGSCAPSS